MRGAESMGYIQVYFQFPVRIEEHAIRDRFSAYRTNAALRGEWKGGALPLW